MHTHSCGCGLWVWFSTGVLSPYRKQGVGALLMNSLLSHVTRLPSCRAIYLHVQASNSSAQRFYNQYVCVCVCGMIQLLYLLCHRLGFREFCIIQDYYLIHKNREDAFLYSCYTNGGVAFPRTCRGYLWRHWEGVHHCINSTCNFLSNCLGQVMKS